MKKQIKVGEWFSKYDTQQQEAFIKLMGMRHDVQRHRSLISSARREFGKDVEFVKSGLVKVKGDLFMFSQDNKVFYKV